MAQYKRGGVGRFTGIRYWLCVLQPAVGVMVAALLLLSCPALASDETAIGELYQQWDQCLEAEDLDGTMALYSDGFLNRADDKSNMRDGFAEFFASHSGIAVTITNLAISITGSTATATMHLTITTNEGTVLDSDLSPSSDQEVGICCLRKEAAGWRFYGDQVPYQTWAFTGHSHVGYWLSLEVRDPGHYATSVTVSGPGITPANCPLAWGEHWDWPRPMVWFLDRDLSLPPPTPPLTYTFTITGPSGTTVLQEVVEGYCEEFATGLSPSGGETVYDPLIFNWTGVSLPGATYGVQLRADSWNGYPLWEIYDLTDTSVAYSGPPLASNRTYAWAVLVFDALGNQSITFEMFLVGTHTLSVTASANPVTVASGGTSNLTASYTDNLGHGIASWSWTDGGAGGTFSPSATVQNPSYKAPANTTGGNRTVTLTVSASCNGPSPRTASKSTSLTVLPAPPAAPSTLVARPLSSSQVRLTWQDNSTNETGFKIERRTRPSGSYSQIDTVEANVTTYTDTTCSRLTTYTYRVRAYGPGGDSPYSNEATVTTLRFDDVPLTSPYWRYVEAIAREGISTGCSTQPPLFCPTGLVTRELMAAFLCRALGLAQLRPAIPTFADVPPTRGSYGYVEALAAAKITGGCRTEGSVRYFCPTGLLTREQMALQLCRAVPISTYNKPVPTFSDVPKSSAYYIYVEGLYRAGVTQGCATQPLRYCPTSGVGREMMAVFLCRAFEISTP